MENLALNDEQLFEEAKERALSEGVTTEEAWGVLVEDVISSHVDVGELHDDQNLENKEDVLTARWSEVEAELNNMVE